MLDFAYFLSSMALTADSDRTNSRGLPLFFNDFTNRFQCRQTSRMTHGSMNVHKYEIADTSHILASRNNAKVGVSSSSWVGAHSTKCVSKREGVRITMVAIALHSRQGSSPSDLEGPRNKVNCSWDAAYSLVGFCPTQRLCVAGSVRAPAVAVRLCAAREMAPPVNKSPTRCSLCTWVVQTNGIARIQVYSVSYSTRVCCYINQLVRSHQIKAANMGMYSNLMADGHSSQECLSLIELHKVDDVCSI